MNQINFNSSSWPGVFNENVLRLYSSNCLCGVAFLKDKYLGTLDIPTEKDDNNQIYHLEIVVSIIIKKKNPKQKNYDFCFSIKISLLLSYSRFKNGILQLKINLFIAVLIIISM